MEQQELVTDPQAAQRIRRRLRELDELLDRLAALCLPSPTENTMPVLSALPEALQIGAPSEGDVTQMMAPAQECAAGIDSTQPEHASEVAPGTESGFSPARGAQKDEQPDSSHCPLTNELPADHQPADMFGEDDAVHSPPANTAAASPSHTHSVESGPTQGTGAVQHGPTIVVTYLDQPDLPHSGQRGWLSLLRGQHDNSSRPRKRALSLLAVAAWLLLAVGALTLGWAIAYWTR
ncbi:MAG: hypothetical protein C4297_01655 [Gemmataceae bacterium]